MMEAVSLDPADLVGSVLVAAAGPGSAADLAPITFAVSGRLAGFRSRPNEDRRILRINTPIVANQPVASLPSGK